MIIIKNILYFIQIRHTDDFPSGGTLLAGCLLVVIMDAFIKRQQKQAAHRRYNGENTVIW